MEELSRPFLLHTLNDACRGFLLFRVCHSPLVSQIMLMKLRLRGWILRGSGFLLLFFHWTRTLAICQPSIDTYTETPL